MAADRMIARAAGAAALLLSAAPLIAATSAIGRTWPVIEPDALVEIEGRAAAAAPLAPRFGTRDRWSALRAATLGVAQLDRVRTVVPTYTLDHEIRLPDGQLLYPRGYRFNPLHYVSLDRKLIVVHPRDLPWALGVAAPSDMILLTAGDAIGLSAQSGRPLFILEQRIKDRLGLTVAPVVVAQKGDTLRLAEHRPDHDPVRRLP